MQIKLPVASNCAHRSPSSAIYNTLPPTVSEAAGSRENMCEIFSYPIHECTECTYLRFTILRSIRRSREESIEENSCL